LISAPSPLGSPLPFNTATVDPWCLVPFKPDLLDGVIPRIKPPNVRFSGVWATAVHFFVGRCVAYLRPKLSKIG